MEKLHVLAYSGHLQVLTTFLLKEFYIICLDRVVIVLARKLSKPEDGRFWAETFSFSIANKHYHLAIYL